jgi:hypothetical protein
MERGKSSPQQCGLAVDKTNVLKALDGLLDTGVAVLGRDVELFLILYRLSGEIFVFGDNRSCGFVSHLTIQSVRRG